MPRDTSTEELKKVYALAELPIEDLEWILSNSELRVYDDGALISRPGDPADMMWIVLDGKLSIYMDVNGRQVFWLTLENEPSSGGIGGMMPRSRMKVFVGYWYSVGRSRMLLFPVRLFEELEQRNPAFVLRLFGYMTERAKTFATIQLQHEKVNALGKLSAGIAHEMNNPAAAIKRIAAELRTRLTVNAGLTSKMLDHNIHSQDIERMRAVALEKQTSLAPARTALQKMDAEDEIVDWFAENNIAEDRDAAETFAEFGFTVADLVDVRQSVNNDAFSEMLRWLQNTLIAGRLITDLDVASGRISSLVGAIKSHVHMDQTNDMQRTDFRVVVATTITLLGYKLRDKSIAVKKEFADGLPLVDAYVGELNQVWMNVFDNAIDALGKNGELSVEAFYDKKSVTVRIVDNGPGIPKEIQSRIFDPFFTTKKVGQGTGIGLDLVKRVIERHQGEIKVESEPGRTAFIICIPITPPK